MNRTGDWRRSSLSYASRRGSLFQSMRYSAHENEAAAPQLERGVRSQPSALQKRTCGYADANTFTRLQIMVEGRSYGDHSGLRFMGNGIKDRYSTLEQ